MNLSNYKTIKNFLDKKTFLKCQEILFGELPWFYRGELVEDKKNNFYFTHSFMKEQQVTSPAYDHIIKPFVERLRMKYIFEIRANLILKTDKEIFSGFHVDTDKSSTTAIFYVNNNNGHTILDKKKKIKIKPTANKLLIFNNELPHGVMAQTNTKRRIIINFNYTPHELI